MLKKLILTALMLSPLLLLAQSQSVDYNITVELSELKTPATAYLVSSYAWTNQRIIDSAKANNGTFVFKGKAMEPMKVHLAIDHTGRGLNSLDLTLDTRVMYLEKGNILINGDDSVKNATITGSKLNTEYLKYHKAVSSAYEENLKVINAEYRTASADKKKDEVFIKSVMAKVKKGSQQQDIFKYSYIKENPDSYFSLEALIELAGKDIDVYKIEPIFKNLSADLRNSKMGKEFAKLVYDQGPTSIGSIAPNFTQNDVDDKPVALSDFKGKYVLLDFWASWCGPCRGENPNVVAAYNKYKDKNFTVLGVSLDNPGKKDAWLAAIKADGLTWTQVSDLQGWKNAAAILYEINAIPKNFLIDPSGKIIAKNLRGELLDKRLEELLAR